MEALPMSGLYVKLDAEYASDDKLIAAGPMAELLYIRGLAFCKRQMVDGVIKTNQLAAVALGIPSAAKHAAALVEHGAWVTVRDGWRIAAWLKRNKSVAEITDDREARRVASMEANHAQHHVGPGKKRSPKCDACRAESRSANAPRSEPITEPKSEPPSEASRIRGRLQEEEPEPEEEEEPEPEEEEEPEPEEEEEPRSSTSLRAANGEPREIQATITQLADRFRIGDTA
jgi:hypothetical protein